MSVDNFPISLTRLSIAGKTLKHAWKVALPLLFAILCAGCEPGDSGLYRASAWLRYEEAYPEFGEPVGGDRQQFAQTQRQIILSPLIMEPVLAMPSIAQISEISSAEEPVKLLLQRVTVEQSEDHDLWIISAQASDAEDAATIANTIVECYFRMSTQDSAQQSARRVDLLEDERARQKVELMRLADQLSELQGRSGGVSSTLTIDWNEKALEQSFLRVKAQQDEIAMKLLLNNLNQKSSQDPVADSDSESTEQNPEDSNSETEKLTENQELKLQLQALQTREADLLKARTEIYLQQASNLDFQNKLKEFEETKADVEVLSNQIAALRKTMRAPGRVTLLRKAEPPNKPGD